MVNSEEQQKKKKNVFEEKFPYTPINRLREYEDFYNRKSDY